MADEYDNTNGVKIYQILYKVIGYILFEDRASIKQLIYFLSVLQVHHYLIIWNLTECASKN